jgi:hypothetical protein
MATKQEIIDGMQQVVAQARRVSKLIDEQGDWDATRPAGWTPKEMFIHLASASGMIATMGPGMLAAPVEMDPTTQMNITQINAQSVASMADKTPPELLQAIEANYKQAAAWVEGLSDEQLNGPKTFAQMTLPASDILCNIGVLHANHHLYEAALRVAF